MNANIYGIKNCSTMKKAFDWLGAHDIAFSFHDYRKVGIDIATLERWCASIGWQALVNTRGTTWRKLDPEQQCINNEQDAINLMQGHPSLIRRPVIELDAGELLVGFDTNRYSETFGKSGVTE